MIGQFYREIVMKISDSRYTDGTRIRLVKDKTGDLPKSIMRRRGTIVSYNEDHSKLDGIHCYDVVMDNRVYSKVLYHDEMELICPEVYIRIY